MKKKDEDTRLQRLGRTENENRREGNGLNRFGSPVCGSILELFVHLESLMSLIFIRICEESHCLP